MPVDLMLIEAMAQFAGGLAFRGRPGHGYLSAIDRCSIDRLIVAGDVVQIRVEREAEFGGIFRFRLEHRPLHHYFRAFEAAGLGVTALREPRPDDNSVAEHPEFANLQRVPNFLHLLARRID